MKYPTREEMNRANNRLNAKLATAFVLILVGLLILGG